MCLVARFNGEHWGIKNPSILWFDSKLKLVQCEAEALCSLNIFASVFVILLNEDLFVKGGHPQL
jgi:hypothetical protein